MTLAYVGLGANLGDPRNTVSEAMLELGQLPRSRVVGRSSLYRSAPLGSGQQPDFVNAVVGLDTDLGPESLLNELQEIEKRHGRERPFPGAPRTLDLDLLLHGDARISTPRLSVPHPRMHERAFVLKPLTEIAPDASIPGLGKARDLLPGCTDQLVERIA
jgi:2-amino-4-hydroxy-6-hydroxymethyldihydropteridine diphosphokinase